MTTLAHRPTHLHTVWYAALAAAALAAALLAALVVTSLLDSPPSHAVRPAGPLAPPAWSRTWDGTRACFAGRPEEPQELVGICRMPRP